MLDLSRPWRARIQLTLPVRVLISPLCATRRNGWASGQFGNVFVLKRWCTSASADVKSGSARSANIGPSWSAFSIPLYTMVFDDRLAT